MVKRKIDNIQTVIFLALAIMILGGLSAMAQSNTRIEFPPGSHTVTLKGTGGETNKDYVLRATEGQRLQVNLRSSNPYGRFNLYRTNYGEPLGSAGELVEGVKDATGWNGGPLEAPGDYHIYVFNPKGENTPFTLEVTLLPAGARAEDYDGYFSTQGKALKGFQDFEGIQLTTIKYMPGGKTMPVKAKASVYAHNRHYDAVNTMLKGSSLSFETVAISGVSYQFTGAFHKGSATDPKIMVLKGHLTKKQNGKQVAERDVELEYEEGVD
jgi:hypothetical protein